MTTSDNTKPGRRFNGGVEQDPLKRIIAAFRDADSEQAAHTDLGMSPAEVVRQLLNSRISHQHCDHPRTKSAMARCRAERMAEVRGQAVPEPSPARARVDHSECSHSNTPSARKKCRARRVVS
ncbi:hypothetical protein AB0H49_32020 [Nocardia sp. NPDC050713]|uniref:hypothetical protein n=1 Tax=Nocardia sp. NPDC050713 TaxID=3154511 RepID=UPI0033E04375